MMFPPYIRSAELFAGMSERPDIPFFISPSDYRVVDGDTLRVVTKKGEEAFRIRFFSMDTPEPPKLLGVDRVMQDIGLDLYPGNPASLARDAILELTRDRALLVEPQVDPKTNMPLDKFRRLLAHVAISGAPGELFVPEGARSLEYALFQKGLARLMKNRPMPEPVPSLVLRMRDAIEDAKIIAGDRFSL